MTVTARNSSSQGGDDPARVYSWLIEYDDVTRHVTGDGTAPTLNVTVVIQITAAGGTKKVQFLQPGRQADADTDFVVPMNGGPTVIGPTIAPAQVARIVGKIGTVAGGLPVLAESSFA